MHIGLIGTRGIPARYGGFETAIEEVGSRLVDQGHRVTVFCRGAEEKLPTYRGMELVHLPALPRRSLETLSHTAASVVHRSLSGADCAIVFNAANAPLLPVLRARRIPVATHVDGLEWRRTKWGPTGRRYYRLAESLAVRWSDLLIADAQGIADYYRLEFGAPTQQIAYGAPLLRDLGHDRLEPLGLSPRGYHLVVARFEPENHILEIVRGYVASGATRPLVVVGSAPYSDAYTERIHEEADDRVRLLGGLWDQGQLDQLYGNALSYLHGHSVGGTNPSLLRACGAGAPVIAFDVPFNREVLGELGEHFARPADVAAQIEAAEARADTASERGRALQEWISRYDWDDVADAYARLCADLAARTTHHARLSGRRLLSEDEVDRMFPGRPGDEDA